MSRDRGRPPHADLLTPAEWRVADAVRHGMSNRLIAERQGVSLEAVKYHLKNALPKLGLARRSELRAWQGVRADSALATAAPAQPGLRGLAQIARSVGDLDAAVTWYVEALGLAPPERFPGMAFFDLGGVRLYLQSHGEPTAESILYFAVDDIQATYAELSAKGVVFDSAPHRIHVWPDGVEEWLAFFRDNEARPLALSARVMPQPQGKPDAHPEG